MSGASSDWLRVEWKKVLQVRSFNGVRTRSQGGADRGVESWIVEHKDWKKWRSTNKEGGME